MAQLLLSMPFMAFRSSAINRNTMLIPCYERSFARSLSPRAIDWQMVMLTLGLLSTRVIGLYDRRLAPMTTSTLLGDLPGFVGSR